MNNSSPGGNDPDKFARKWLKMMSSLTKYLVPSPNGKRIRRVLGYRDPSLTALAVVTAP
ncbi:Uncharacterised protein [Mycobacteroides abscessus subsp. abscessus]|nr:Uncharacterised protein [Mycobacteroides abscessus subsp. abscessus]SHY67613.1 Uncharacterised protein [Mycobacteroides abscessus subsp. abscessus]SIC65846.1 Uncharacterised protein [Mycobacteroides abscessus subsp. abscessus]SID49209.1 Uncharacterised protein [Mycobacteroides abscessus subsp. abscessus]SIE41016.1 Uncharacterised protein [Mycobacteroides abscessus subsp. abscessus]